MTGQTTLSRRDALKAALGLGVACLIPETLLPAALPTAPVAEACDLVTFITRYYTSEILVPHELLEDSAFDLETIYRDELAARMQAHLTARFLEA